MGRAIRHTRRLNRARAFSVICQYFALQSRFICFNCNIIWCTADAAPFSLSAGVVDLDAPLDEVVNEELDDPVAWRPD